MPFTALTQAQVKEAVEAMRVHGSQVKAAAALKMSRSALKARLDAKGRFPDLAANDTVQARERIRFHEPAGAPEITYPAEVDDDIPVTEIIDLMSRRFAKRAEAQAAKKLQTITLSHSEPIVVGFVGDPHLDDDGCDWPKLREDIELFKRPYVYGVNVGDSTNNWTGRLMRLYANQETSLKTARKLVKWFLVESGIKWLAWTLGNHDAWESGGEIIRLMNTTGVPMDDWSAKFRVRFANDAEVPFWVSHDFKGSSQWNSLHGPMKAALMRGGAGVYACGHKHCAGLHWEPLQDQDAAYWIMRSRGYKVIDDHAEVNGFPSQNDGHTTAVVIDPSAKHGRDMIQGFKDLRAAVIYREGLAARQDGAA
jgi:hypothetical protein